MTTLEATHLGNWSCGTTAALAGLMALLAGAPAWAQVDFSGEWAPFYHEDPVERGPGAELGDYTELPINDAARMQADSYDADRISVVEEYQCRAALARLRISQPRQSAHLERGRFTHATHRRLP